MKVLHVIPSLSRLRGGPTFVVQTLAAHQARAGMEVHVVTTDDDCRGRQAVPLAKPVSSGGATYWYFRRTTRAYESSIGLASWLHRYTARFDVVHIHSVFTFPSTAAARIASRRSVPYVIRPLGVLNRWGMRSGRAWAKRLSIRMVEAQMLRRAAAVQFASEKERAETQSACSISRPVVIPNPVEIVPAAAPGLFRARYPMIGDRQMLLFLGRLADGKGAEVLLDAFAALRKRRPRTVLVMSGAGEELYVRSLQGQAEALGIAGAIVWTGFLDQSAKAAALADADVFVAPSQSESFGISVVEALAAGVPAVVSSGVGIADEIAQAGAALVVAPDAGEIANAAERILDDFELASGLAAQGRELVRRRYQAAAVADRVMQLYAEIGGRG